MADAFEVEKKSLERSVGQQEAEAHVVAGGLEVDILDPDRSRHPVTTHAVDSPLKHLLDHLV